MGKVIAAISGLLHLSVSGCLPVQCNGRRWGVRQNLSSGEIMLQEWADWGVG